MIAISLFLCLAEPVSGLMGVRSEGGWGRPRPQCDGHLVIWADSLWNEWILIVRWSPTSLRCRWLARVDGAHAAKTQRRDKRSGGAAVALKSVQVIARSLAVQ